MNNYLLPLSFVSRFLKCFVFVFFSSIVFSFIVLFVVPLISELFEKNKNKNNKEKTKLQTTSISDKNRMQAELVSEFLVRITAHLNEILSPYEEDLIEVIEPLKKYFIESATLLFKNKVFDKSDFDDNVIYAYTLELMSLNLYDIIKENDDRFCVSTELTEKGYDRKLVNIYIHLINQELLFNYISESEHKSKLNSIFTSKEIDTIRNNKNGIKEEINLYLSKVNNDALSKKLRFLFLKELENFKDLYSTDLLSLDEPIFISCCALILMKAAIEKDLRKINVLIMSNQGMSNVHLEDELNLYKLLLDEQLKNGTLSLIDYDQQLKEIKKYSRTH